MFSSCCPTCVGQRAIDLCPILPVDIFLRQLFEKAGFLSSRNRRGTPGLRGDAEASLQF